MAKSKKFSHVAPTFAPSGIVLRDCLPQRTDEEKSARAPTLTDILERGCDWVAGGHRIWKHSERRVKLNGRMVTIQRAAWEAENGTIPAGRFLLSHCSVSGCISPKCHTVSRYAKWYEHVLHTHLTPTSEPGYVCSGQCDEAACLR